MHYKKVFSNLNILNKIKFNFNNKFYKLVIKNIIIIYKVKMNLHYSKYIYY